MEIKPVLRDIRFGEEVAEHDNLGSYFVQTSSFDDFVRDDFDLVLGQKGSGKSAIYQRVIDPDAEIPELRGVDIVPAFTSPGQTGIEAAAIFEPLSGVKVAKLTDPLMEIMWLTFICGLVGNHLLDEYDHLISNSELPRIMRITQLRIPKSKRHNLWISVLSAIKRAAHPKSMEVAVTLTPTAAPLLMGRIEFGDKQPSQGTSEAVDLQDLLNAELDILARTNRKCWVVFDRLDEAFPHDRHLERVALRGLLRAHATVSRSDRSGRLRSKLFLRTDLLSRITEEQGYVNASHLRVHRISWDREMLVHLVARRIIGERGFVRAFGDDWDRQITSEQGQLSACAKVLPARVGRAELFKWLIQRTSDASTEPNPRNLLTLLKAAKRHMLKVCDREAREYDVGIALIDQQALWEGWRMLSNARLEDTLFAEFQSLKGTIQKFHGHRRHLLSEEALAGLLGYSTDDADFHRVVLELEDSGFLRKTPKSAWAIPLMYRPALGIPAKFPRSPNLGNEPTLLDHMT
jgi:hypothetical protein